MKMKLHAFHVATLAAVLLCVAAVQANDPRQKAAYESRLSSMGSLTQALKSNPKAGSASVKQTLDQVAARRKEAEELAAAGEFELARSILDEGYNALTKTLAEVTKGDGYAGPSGSMSGMSGMTGMIGADGKPIALAKMKADFERDLMSATSMLGPSRRANDEAGGKHGSEVAAIESLIEKARKAAAAEDYVTADRQIDEALKRDRALMTTVMGAKPQAATGSAAASAADEKAMRERAIAQFDGRLAMARSMLSATKSQNASKSAGRDASIAEIEQKLARAESMRTSDPVGGLALIDQAYATTRTELQGMSGGGGGPKSGTAALDGARDMSGMTGEQKTAAIASQLRTTKTLRDAYERKAREKGVDSSATLARIDGLMADARATEGSNPSQALQKADEAYKLAKSSLEAARSN